MSKWLIIGMMFVVVGLAGVVLSAPTWVFFLELFITGLFFIQVELLDD